MNQSLVAQPIQLAILGRQAKLSLAELEARYGAESLQPLGEQASLVQTAQRLNQTELGGTLKTATLLARLPSFKIEAVFEQLGHLIIDQLGDLPDGKLQLGLSVYGSAWPVKQINGRLLGLKKQIKATGRSLRVIENKQPQLSSAQVLYNKLTAELGCEMLVVIHDGQAFIAQTYGVQDIDAYAERDYGRPKRDALNGMLPPKLAQIMLNLALDSGNPNRADGESHNPIIVDPFCGTGVVLQEALLRGFEVIGSDVNPVMIDYADQNLAWLAQLANHQTQLGKVQSLTAADATSHHWPITNHQPTIVVAETFLGTPLLKLPAAEKLQSLVQPVEVLIEQFLSNIQRQLPAKSRLCLALPAWRIGPNRFQHLKVLEKLSSLGYNRLEYKWSTVEDLLYAREDQIVARELVVLVRV